jgi:membrane fusion protein, heavy metal efflux system
MFRSAIAAVLVLPSAFFLNGCDGLQKGAKASDSTAIVHDGSRVTVPTSNPLSNRLQVEAAEFTTVQRQVAAPASVEADPARYARILPPLSGHILQLFVRPGDTVKKGQELLSIDAPDFVGAQADYSRSRSVLAQTEHALTRQEDTALSDRRILTKPRPTANRL